MSLGPYQTTVFAPAKINLFLHVGAKRTDGYHDICSLAAFADVGDRLDAIAAAELSLAISGPFATGLANGDDNLVMRAGHVLQAWARGNGQLPGGARLMLEKNLPIASGIGGGSSDAAATLKRLNHLWRLNASNADLMGVAETLGADVPVCLHNTSTLMEGLGERLTPWPKLPPLLAVLVNPGVALMTAHVFATLDKRSGAYAPAPTTFASPRDLAAWLRSRANDLEAPARHLAPIIDDVLAEISATQGCLLARMSGSGATCFGLYESEGAASDAASALASRRPTWWIEATALS